MEKSLHTFLTRVKPRLRHQAALPATEEIRLRALVHRETRNRRHVIAIARAAMILAPSGRLGVAKQIGPGEAATVASFGAAKAAKIFFGPIRARAVRAVSLLVIDALYFKRLMQAVP